ncbi:cupin domain-containing protein [Nocardia sp. NPDC051570]|uniref:(R)-mandelonitrile lyase n=1 Tax=Nocardia sp. NPDC051570 TaxID=3364324 RepID=UPI0037B9BADD
MELLPTLPTIKAPAEMFTGDVWIDFLYRGEDPSQARMYAVHFSPCARTAWHSHAVGQVLHVTEGIGLVATRDGTVIVMRPGDTVHTPPGEWHWHGATPDHFMTHLGMQETDDVTWGEHVTDEEYRSAATHCAPR